MSKTDSSPLALAAAEFDLELATYARLGDLFLKTPLSSVKHLERANGALAEIAGCEERLHAAGQKLVKALAGARDHQEQLAKEVVAHVPVLQQRNLELQALMTELAAVAQEVGSLNAVLQGKTENGDATAHPTKAEARDVSERALHLSTRSETLAAEARAAHYEELATQAHALHQKLLVIGHRLQKAADE